jgi:superfamily II DNA/RNA helicase
MYFHRVGRTARAGGSGKSYIFVSQEELEDFIRIQDLTTANIKPAPYGDRKEYSRNLLNLKNIHSNESENVDEQISKYCGRCGKLVTWVSEGPLCKCRDCGKILY